MQKTNLKKHKTQIKKFTDETEGCSSGRRRRRREGGVTTVLLVQKLNLNNHKTKNYDDNRMIEF